MGKTLAITCPRCLVQFNMEFAYPWKNWKLYFRQRRSQAHNSLSPLLKRATVIFIALLIATLLFQKLVLEDDGQGALPIPHGSIEDSVVI